MAINTQKVVVGGLAAGVVNTALGYALFAMWLGPRFNAEMDAVIPGASAKMMSGAANMVVGIGSNFVGALVLTWLYAAVRPRFGPGPKTAAYVAVATWIFGALFYYSQVQIGLMSSGTYMLGSIVALVLQIIVANVGAFLYKEEGV
jgi:hypothetical protein